MAQGIGLMEGGKYLLAAFLCNYQELKTPGKGGIVARTFESP